MDAIPVLRDGFFFMDGYKNSRSETGLFVIPGSVRLS